MDFGLLFGALCAGIGLGTGLLMFIVLAKQFLLVGESFLWFGLVAVLFSSHRVLEWLRRHMLWFDRVVGVALLGLAAKLTASVAR